MRTTLLLIAAVTFAAAGCVGGQEKAERTTSIEGHGLSVIAPDGWTGRVIWPGPKYAITLDATTGELPRPGEFATGDLLGKDDAYVAVTDIGPPPAGIGREGTWTVDPELPLAIASDDVLGPFQGGFPAGASVNVVIENRSLMIAIRFGSWPGADEIDEVNKLLGSLAVAPRKSR